MSATVRQLLDQKYDLEMAVVAGEAGLDNAILSSQAQKSGLALTGGVKHIYPGWIQVFGNSEISFLDGLSEPLRQESLAGLCEVDVAAIVVTRGNAIPHVLRDLADEREIPVLSTPLITATFFDRLHWALDRMLAPTTSLHGVLVDVFGVGVLLLGPSGVGKSECALDLIFRGHRLVADDIIDIVSREKTLIGRGYQLIKHYMEIRGLGIINIKDLFGVAAVCESKRIDLVMELVDWDEEVEYDRLGIDEKCYTLFGTSVPHMVIPVRPGRHIAVIIETAARNQLLKAQGHHSALKFQQELTERISQPIGTKPDGDVE